MPHGSPAPSREVRAAAVSGLGVMGVAARGFQDEAREVSPVFQGENHRKMVV